VLDGDEETFDIFVIYDTKKLYGKVRGQRQVTIARE
jgi:hypothetical protein